MKKGGSHISSSGADQVNRRHLFGTQARGVEELWDKRDRSFALQRLSYIGRKSN